MVMLAVEWICEKHRPKGQITIGKSNYENMGSHGQGWGTTG